ncbi:MAG: STAS domain-containing protein [Ruminococcus sp.]|nr:STAS domain-containing protein [Ruminococcus sp.]
MTTAISFENDVYTVVISGRIDTLTAPELEQTFKEIEPKANKVIFDMNAVEYVSSAGMRAIIAVHRAMSQKGGLVLRGLTKNVRTIINLTGFNKVLTIEE